MIRRSILVLAAVAALAPLPALVPAAAQPQSAFEQAAVSAVQANIDAYRSWDLDRFVATFAPDAVVMANGITAKGHAQIRAFYASNFAGVPHTIRIVESDIEDGVVTVTVAYTFSDGQELCCSYSEYVAQGGKITFLSAQMQRR